MKNWNISDDPRDLATSCPVSGLIIRVVGWLGHVGKDYGQIFKRLCKSMQMLRMLLLNLNRLKC